MGLDCHLVARSPEVQRLPLAERLQAEIELAYWRKNFPLNNRMHQIALDESDWPPLDHYFPVGVDLAMTPTRLRVLFVEEHLSVEHVEAALRHLARGDHVLYWSVP